MNTLAAARVLAALVLVALALLYLYLTWHSGYADLLSDSAVYLLMASVLDPAQQVPNTVLHAVMSQYHFPPLFPVTLGLFGGGAYSPRVSHLVNTGLIVTSFLCYLVWLRSLGMGRYGALTLLLPLALLPSALYFANFIVSEFLYMTLSLLGLAALERSREKTSLVYVAAIMVGLAIASRTIGVALLPALSFVAYRIRRKSVFPVLAIAVSPILFWTLYKASYGSSNYVSSFFLSHRNDFTTSVAVYAWVNLQVLGLSWIKTFDHFISDYSTIPSAILGALVVVGWLSRMRKGEPDAVYVLCYVLILVPWPHPEHIHRFLLPLMPILIYYGSLALKLPGRRQDRRTTTALLQLGYFTLVLALTLPTNINLAQRLTTNVPTHLADFSRSHVWLFSRKPEEAIVNIEFLHFMNSAMTEAAMIPEEDCVWSIDPARQMLLSNRVSYNTPPPKLDDASFRRALSKCRYLFPVRAKPYPNHSGITAMYPIERIDDDVEILRKFEHDTLGTISMLMVLRSD